jgi:hypothetical protein
MMLVLVATIFKHLMFRAGTSSRRDPMATDLELQIRVPAKTRWNTGRVIFKGS